MARPQLKSLIADCLHNLIVDSRWARVHAIEDVKEITFSRPTDLITQIRVVTQSDGVHYYEVRLKENL